MRPVYRAEARFYVGLCAINIGSPKAAAAHFAKWDLTDSKWTPRVFVQVGLILASQKKYKGARTWFAKIAQLDGIGMDWKRRASLYDVNVDIMESKFDEAEGKARALARAIGNKPETIDSLAAAYNLQARAVIASGKKERLPQAEKAPA